MGHMNFYSLLLSKLPFSFSFESLFHQTNIRDSPLKFEPGLFQLPRMFQNGGKRASGKAQKALSCFWLWCPLSWIPFLEIGLPKITKGRPFDSNLPISRINPASHSVKRSVN